MTDFSLTTKKQKNEVVCGDFIAALHSWNKSVSGSRRSRTNLNTSSALIEWIICLHSGTIIIISYILSIFFCYTTIIQLTNPIITKFYNHTAYRQFFQFKVKEPQYKDGVKNFRWGPNCLKFYKKEDLLRSIVQPLRQNQLINWSSMLPDVLIGQILGMSDWGPKLDQISIKRDKSGLR